jgi:hypothetical protein
MPPLHGIHSFFESSLANWAPPDYLYSIYSTTTLLEISLDFSIFILYKTYGENQEKEEP